MPESNLEDLKKEYKKLQKKYNLPNFDYINQNFEIENMAEVETDLLLKKIRKHIMEKIYYIFIKLEAFLNPQNVSVFVFNIIKGFSTSDRELITKLYKEFAEYEVEGFGLEVKYNEQREAKFIKKVLSDWEQVSKDLYKLYESMGKSYDQEIKKQKKSYFG